MANFIGIPSVYPKLLELRQSKTAEFKPNKYLKESTKLRYYQVIGSLHFMLLDRMVLGDSTGIGKTLQVIAAYSWLLQNDPTLKLLVVTPKSATLQWGEEFEKFTQGISYRIISNEYLKETGYNARKKQYGAFKEHVMILGYSSIRSDYEAIKEAIGPNYMMIMDEVVAVKNRKTQTHLACKMVSESAKRVYGLSATIIKNGLEEVYCIYNVVVPGLFGNVTKFKNDYCKTQLLKLKIGGKDRFIPKIIGYKNLEQFKKLIDPYFLKRKKEDVASELPKLISKKIVLEMSSEQKQLYKKALSGILYEEKTKQDYYEVLDSLRLNPEDDKTKKKFDELKEKYDKFLTPEGKKRGKLAALTYCQMISNGPALINETGESSKEEEFLRLMTEELSAEKVILFTRFKKGLPNLEILCERNNIKYSKITGDENDLERQEARLKFQNDSTCNLIFITTAGSAALNLQAAGCLIFYDTPWSYGDLVQTIGRAQRIGSIKENILVIHLANRGTIDMKVLNKVSDKKELSDTVVGGTADGALDFIDTDNETIDELYNSLLKDAEVFCE